MIQTADLPCSWKQMCAQPGLPTLFFAGNRFSENLYKDGEIQLGYKHCM